MFQLDNKLIMTVDLDAFFAQAEEKRHPENMGVPFGVGNELNGRGIVTTANYAAREYGIHSGMPLFKAKELCPGFKLVEADYEYYQKKANEVFNVATKYADKIEFVSIDECYIDVTSLTKKYTPIQIAYIIYKDILRETGLTVSIGISTNILLSKMASNFDKPEGISTLFKHEIPVKLWPMKVGELHNVGKKTSEKFEGYGIMTIGDLAKLDENLELYTKIKQEIGIVLDKHIEAAKGNSTNVVKTEESVLKSVNRNKTFPSSIMDIELLKLEVREVFEFALYRAKRRKLMPSTISVSLKVDKSFNVQSRTKKLKQPTVDTNILWPIVSDAIDTLFEKGMSVKYCGISLEGLKPLAKTYTQLEYDETHTLSKDAKIQYIAENASLLNGVELVTGSTMKDNRFYEKNDPVDRDNIKFKRWDK